MTTVVIWIGIGISTGKFSEQLGAEYFKSRQECEAHMSLYEDFRCLPLAVSADGAKIMLGERT